MRHEPWRGRQERKGDALGPLMLAATVAMARLDERLQGHPLLPAFLFRARLQTVQAQAAVDGYQVDPWRLVAVLEGLPLRQPVDPLDRADLHDATWCAYDLYAWLAFPDPPRRQAIAAARAVLAQAPTGQGALLAGAEGLYRWLWTLNETRPPMRAALVQYWQQAGLLRAPIPLTAAAALRPEAPQEHGAWLADFLRALREEADGFAALLSRLEYGWRTARRAARGRRSTSRAVAVVDLLATRPLVSASRVAAELQMSVNAALQILERLMTDGVVIEATHRGARRLFGLVGLRGVQEAVARPSAITVATDPEPAAVPAAPRPLARTAWEREELDYSDLAAALDAADQAVRVFLSRIEHVAGPGMPAAVDPAPATPGAEAPDFR